MSILRKQEIHELLTRSIDDPCSLRITPLLDPEGQIKDAAVDIRLGSYFLVPRSTKNGLFVPGSTSPQDVASRLHIPLGQRLVIPSRGVVLASAFEYLKMPGHLTAQVLTRSSIGRIFVTTATATLVHPFYRGCLTLEIANLSSVPVELDILSRIAQLQFAVCNDPKNVIQDKISGRYAAATEPEFSKFVDDDEEYVWLRSLLRKGGKD